MNLKTYSLLLLQNRKSTYLRDGQLISANLSFVSHTSKRRAFYAVNVFGKNPADLFDEFLGRITDDRHAALFKLRPDVARSHGP